MSIFWFAAFIVCGLYVWWEVGGIITYWVKVLIRNQKRRARGMPNDFIRPYLPWEAEALSDTAGGSLAISEQSGEAGVQNAASSANPYTLWKYTAAFRPKPIEEVTVSATTRGMIADLIERIGTVEEIEFFSAGVVATGRLDEELLTVYYNTEIRKARQRLQQIETFMKGKKKIVETDYKVLHFFFIARTSYNLQLVPVELRDIVPSILENVPDAGVFLLPADGTLTQKEMLDFFQELQDKRVS